MNNNNDDGRKGKEEEDFFSDAGEPVDRLHAMLMEGDDEPAFGFGANALGSRCAFFHLKKTRKQKRKRGKNLLSKHLSLQYCMLVVV